MSKRPDANDILRERGPDGLREAFDEAKGGNGADKRRRRFTLTPWDNIDYDPKQPAWVVHGLLPTTGVAVIYGKWKTFKTFVALDLGIAVAFHPTWAGRKVTNGAVIYIACEGAAGLDKRIAAYKRTKPELKGLPFYVIKARPGLGIRPGDVDELVSTIRDELGAITPVLIIIDTLARTLAGKDENGEGMRNFLDNAEDLSAALACLVLAVHHEGAGDTGRLRGGTVLDAGSVATWRTARKAGELACTVTVQEAKDSVSDLGFRVLLKAVQFGDEHDEQRESTLIVDSIEAESSDTQPKRERVSPGLRAAMTAIDIGIDQHGSEITLPNRGPRVRAVAIETVRKIYVGKRADDLTEDSKRRTFDRHLESLIDREIVVSGQLAGHPMLWKPKSARKH
jgi:hypothetical protein